MNLPLVIQKYGGTSVGSIERIRHVASHIGQTVASGKKVLAVISAMGDQTDDLLAMAHAISSHPPQRELDMLLTAGERIAMALVSIALNDIGTPAVSLTGSQSGIITDTTHGNARISRISGNRILEQLERGTVVIVAGFQGVSHETKEITTLGRGGSDLSAIALAGHLHASSCELYKDVDGVCTADPRIVKSAKKLDQISWDAMTELAWCGASVLHPRGAHLAAKFSIPIEIRSSFHLDRKGTIVAGQNIMERFVVTAISHRKNMCILSGAIAGNDFEVFDLVRSWMWSKGETPQVQMQTENPEGQTKGLSFRWSMPQDLVADAERMISERCTLLGNFQVRKCGLITIVGSGFWQSPELLPKIHREIKEPLLVEVKNQSITVAVQNETLEQSVQSLHKTLIES